MSYFGDFQHEQLLLILSLPYRAGVWISHIDDAPGTERDDEQEQNALENTLKRIEKQAPDDSFVDQILKEILTHRDEWSAWGAGSATVLEDVPGAVRLVQAQLPKEEALQYQKLVFHIARTVAMAASELSAPDDHMPGAMGGGLFAKLTGWLSSDKEELLPENISHTEKAALQNLLQCLKA